MSNHKLLLVMCASVIIMSACSESVDRRIVLADSLSWSRPDSAMMIMDSIEPMKQSFSKGELMRYELIRAKVQNRAYIDFTTDSVMKEVADYYDHHGSANDRMMAHYLLGCTYRDLKEAPMALQCYYDAVESADTLDRDCDFSTMMSIWGQIASIHSSQCMPTEALEAWKQYQKFALLNKDTLNYITGIEMCVGAYNLLRDTVNVLKTTETASKMFLEIGEKERSAIANYASIYVYLNRHNYDKAKELIDNYASNALYNYGDVVARQEYVYLCKGWYFENVNQLDSAEYYYRKLNNANMQLDYARGMMRIYSEYGNADSVIYYSKQIGNAYDAHLSSKYMNAMEQVRAMYDYSRNQKVAIEKKQESLRYRYVIYSILLATIVVIFVLIGTFKNINRKKTARISSLARQYNDSLSHIEYIKNELQLIKTDENRFIELKQKEIDKLEKQLSEYRQQVYEMTMFDHLEVLLKSDIVASFKTMGNGTKTVSEADWKTLFQTVELYLPNFYTSIIKNSNLTEQEVKICTLVLINIGNIEISNMLNTSPSRISTAKASSNKKLFDDSSARNLRRNIIRTIHK